MDKEKFIQFIASFLIALVLTIPFNTTIAYATISQVSVKGSDGVDGFARTNDFLNFNVQASISNDQITNNQVFLGSPRTGVKFDKCTSLLNNGIECTLRFPSTGKESFEAKLTPFTINLLKDGKTIEDSKSGTVVIDNKPPQVTLSVPQNRFSLQQNVVINYDVTDYACDDTSCANKCVGLKKIDFYTSNGAFKNSVDLANNTNCNIKSSISVDSKTFSDGKNSVFAKATDKFNQASAETSVTFTADILPPSIIANSFAITRKGISLSTFSSNKVSVEVAVNISASDLNMNSVTADLSALNPLPNFKNARASCTQVQDNLSTCKWTLELNPGSEGSKSIVINASDAADNKASITINKQLTLDDKGPVVQSLATSATKDSLVLAKPSGNTVNAVFDEASGLSPDEIFLYVGNSKTAALNCTKQTNWICSWENVDFGSSTQMSIKSDTTDVLANQVSKEKTTDVTIDNKAPILNNLSIIPVGGLTTAIPGIFKIGDKIGVVANVSDDNDVTAVADFSKFISGASQVAGTCQRTQANEHICTFVTDTINLQASDSVTFSFTDLAGNTLSVRRALKTLGLNNETTPDFWTNSVSCSPKTIDRQLGLLTNQRLYCQVSLRPKVARQVSTAFISPATCSGDTSITQNVETFNAETGSISPIVKVTLKKNEFRINNVSLSCSFNIFSKTGTSVTKNPEIENFKINFEFYNLPLGEVSNEVQRKIDDAKKNALETWKIIGNLNKLVQISKRICQTLNTIYTVIATLYIITLGFGHAATACHSSGFLEALGVCAIIETTKTVQCFGTESAHASAVTAKKSLNKFCDFITCKQTFLWGPKVNQWMSEKAPLVLAPGKWVIKAADGKSTHDYSRDITYGRFMDPEHNLLVATLFACLPGIVYGLDKYRQIECLYADCLENAVARDGLPVTACQDQKQYATCKYVTGEIFALFPWTAVFDHYISIIKNALSNPFTVLGIGFAISCSAACPTPGGAGYTICRGAKLAAAVGDAAESVKNIIDTGFTIRQDYCSRLNLNNKQSAASGANTSKTTGY